MHLDICSDWFSILTRTGMHTQPGNDSTHPADVVVDDALGGLEWIIEQELMHQNKVRI